MHTNTYIHTYTHTYTYIHTYIHTGMEGWLCQNGTNTHASTSKAHESATKLPPYTQTQTQIQTPIHSLDRSHPHLTTPAVTTSTGYSPSRPLPLSEKPRNSARIDRHMHVHTHTRQPDFDRDIHLGFDQQDQKSGFDQYHSQNTSSAPQFDQSARGLLFDQYIRGSPLRLPTLGLEDDDLFVNDGQESAHVHRPHNNNNTSYEDANTASYYGQNIHNSDGHHMAGDGEFSPGTRVTAEDARSNQEWLIQRQRERDNLNVNMRVCVCVLCVHVCVCVCVWCMYVCMYVCMYACMNSAL
jgi:hypothetical protein